MKIDKQEKEKKMNGNGLTLEFRVRVWKEREK